MIDIRIEKPSPFKLEEVYKIWIDENFPDPNDYGESDYYHDRIPGPVPPDPDPTLVVSEDQMNALVVEWLRGPMGPTGPMGASGIDARDYPQVLGGGFYRTH